jgi:mRNA interferase RelE/StbE
LTTYKLKFLPSAQKEWDKLDNSIKRIIKKKLEKVLENPCIPANALCNLPNCYKIKLRNLGYRLVYQVEEAEVTVYVVSVGKRDKQEVYHKALMRFLKR